MGCLRVTKVLRRYLKMFEQAGLVVCVVLALASTAIWWALTSPVEPWFSGVGEAGNSTVPELWYWVAVWSSGVAYSTLVLFRYVTGRRRLAAVAGAGALSYWVGVQIAYTPVPWVVINTTVAGVITAMFVGYVVARLGRLRLSVRLFMMLAGAGAIGGTVTGWSAGDLYAREDTTSPVAYVVGHALWQVLTCVALYLSPQDRRSTEGDRE